MGEERGKGEKKESVAMMIIAEFATNATSTHSRGDYACPLCMAAFDGILFVSTLSTSVQAPTEKTFAARPERHAAIRKPGIEQIHFFVRQ